MTYISMPDIESQLIFIILQVLALTTSGGAVANDCLMQVRSSSHFFSQLMYLFDQSISFISHLESSLLLPIAFHQLLSHNPS